MKPHGSSWSRLAEAVSTLISMAQSEAVHLTLEIERSVEPVTGLLRREDGARWRFAGWIELTRVIEEARLTDPSVHSGENP